AFSPRVFVVLRHVLSSEFDHHLTAAHGRQQRAWGRRSPASGRLEMKPEESKATHWDAAVAQLRSGRRSTPYLPWNFSGNRWQPVATVFACFCGFGDSSICLRLPPFATTGLHKGSIHGTAFELAHPQLKRVCD